MSKIFKDIFSSKSKSKSNNKLVKSSTIATDSEIMTHEKWTRIGEGEKPQIMSRKMSLTKSGRMKEKKRKNVSVSDYFPETAKFSSSREFDEDDANCDNDVFSVDDIVKEIHQIVRTEIRT
jgi:hypothetical protein